MDTNDYVKWRRFIVPIKVEQINDSSSHYELIMNVIDAVAPRTGKSASVWI